MNREIKTQVLGRYPTTVFLSRREDYLSVRFRRCDVEGASKSEEIPGEEEKDYSPFDAGISEGAVAQALEFLLNRDSSLRALFLDGSLLEKRIYGRQPVNELNRSSGVSLEEYARMMPILEDLVRPRFLSPPDLDRLLPFQKIGVEWLIRHSRGILADDMGLGKTAQAVSALRLLIHAGEFTCALVVCPKSLLANWETEIAKWAPELTFARVVPKGKDRAEIWSTVVGRFHVLITNYEQLRLVPTVLASSTTSLVVADEAHRIRNMSSSISKGMREVSCERIWALTGTPIERDEKDLATLLSIIEPFRFTVKDASLGMDALRAQAKPLMLRRRKADVLSDLPDVIEISESIELSARQAAKYHRVASSIHWVDDLSILRMINQLRIICDYDPESGDSTKIDRITEIIRDIRGNGEKVVVFSVLLRPLELLHEKLRCDLGDDCAVSLRGDMSVYLRDVCIRDFKTRKEVTALLASMRVGGEGLTLTEANNVIFVNQWWNPSANSQAQDRVVRIGQQRGVRVYRFTCLNTIEEQLEMILAEKKEVTFEVIDRLADTSHVDPEVGNLVKLIRSNIV